MELGIYKTHPDIILPKHATEQSACFDIMFQSAGKNEYTIYTAANRMKQRSFVNVLGKRIPEIHIGPNERAIVPTGIRMDIPKGHSVRLHSRSGLALKSGLVLINGEGVVDSDFVDEIMLLMHNTSTANLTIRDLDRVAQGELIADLKYTFKELDRPSEVKTDRVGGFGSTGVTHVAVTETEKPIPVLKRGRGRPRLNRD